MNKTRGTISVPRTEERMQNHDATEEGWADLLEQYPEVAPVADLVVADSREDAELLFQEISSRLRSDSAGDDQSDDDEVRVDVTDGDTFESLFEKARQRHGGRLW